MRIAVDASNLMSGGGVTHLENFFSHLELPSHEFTEIVTWCAPHVAERIDQGRPGQTFIPVDAFTQGMYQRHRYRLGTMKKAIEGRFDVLFVPGGLALDTGIPQVVMSRNLQPFQPSEIRVHLPSYSGLRLLALRFLQARSFKRADRVIFLNRFAAEFIGGKLAIPETRQAIVPHGVSDKFRLAKNSVTETPKHVLYVSTFNGYKHQIEVIDACTQLRARHPELTLSLVGGQSSRYGEEVLQKIARVDPSGSWISAPGKLGIDELIQQYRQADLFVFASSCENLPNILLEAMAVGLPIACSDAEPMPSVLKDAGVYFQSRNSGDIYQALDRLMSDSELRTSLAARAQSHVSAYTWEKCVENTLAVLRDAVAAPLGARKCAE